MGWVYNLEDQNAPTQAPRLIAICITFSTVALLAVVLRFYVRLRTKKGLWIDDYASLFSAVGYDSGCEGKIRLIGSDPGNWLRGGRGRS